MDKSLYEFGQEMARVLPRFVQEVLKRMSKPLLAGDITMSQMLILSFLREKANCKMVDIARELSITTSAITGHVDRMVRQSLVKRIANEEDRRIINIEMTEKGKKIIDNIEKMRYKMLLELFGKLAPVERNRYLETVKKLYRILTEQGR